MQINKNKPLISQINHFNFPFFHLQARFREIFSADLIPNVFLILHLKNFVLQEKDYKNNYYFESTCAHLMGAESSSRERSDILDSAIVKNVVTNVL